jgi:hypothetical protein
MEGSAAPAACAGDFVLEPGPSGGFGLADYPGERNPRRYEIARLSRWTRLVDDIDAAIALVHGQAPAVAAALSDPHWQPRATMPPLVGLPVRLIGATSGAVEGEIASVDASVFDHVAGVELKSMIQYGERLADGSWQAITRPGDSGAILLQGTPARGVGLHVMAGSPQGPFAAESYSYANSLDAVLERLGSLPEPGGRRGEGPRLGKLRLAHLPGKLEGPRLPDLNPSPVPDPVPDHEKEPHVPKNAPGASPCCPQVVFNLHFAGGCGSGATVPVVVPGGPRSLHAPNPNLRQGFTRFTRVRWSNGSNQGPTGRVITGATVTPARVQPPPAPPQAPPPGPQGGTPAPVVPVPPPPQGPPPPPAPLDDRASILHDHTGAGTAPDMFPNAVYVDYAFDVPNGNNPSQRQFVVDLSSVLVGPPHEDFIQEVDVEFRDLGNGQHLAFWHASYVTGMGMPHQAEYRLTDQPGA